MSIEFGPEPAEAVPLRTTPLDRLHRSLGARMVAFAGWSMPVQYPAGVLAEHLHCRAEGGAALFDVSHMGQASLHGAAAAAALETLLPGDIQGLGIGRQRYSVLTNEAGGIIDDLMVARLAADRLFLVVNASRRGIDLPHIAAHLPAGVTLEPHEDRALLALQGPGAAAVMARLGPAAAALAFMGFAPAAIGGIGCLVSRSGYTGEDGFEISVPDDAAEDLARLLLAQAEVRPAGLGARDSLRLEAGLCLYGHDIDAVTTPVEAALQWSIQKSRRAGGARAGGFPGADKILAQLANGAPRRRVGLRPEGRAPVREGAPLFADASSSAQIGAVTSGGFGPSINAPVAMGYLPSALAEVGDVVFAELRGQRLPLRIAPMPFVPNTYKR